MIKNNKKLARIKYFFTAHLFESSFNTSCIVVSKNNIGFCKYYATCFSSEYFFNKCFAHK